MKISHSYKLFAVIITLLLTIIVIVIFKTLSIQEDVMQSEQHRFRSFSLAVELFQSSEDLTRMARSYVSTGNPIYEKHYFEILDIRNGKQPRPAHYTSTYWHLAGVGRGTAIAQGEAIALQELMRREGFTQQEFTLLRESQANSDHLVKMEKQAFAALKGLYDDGHGNFTMRRAPNHDYAVHLLYSDAYAKEKARIMAPIEQFMDVLDRRTNAELLSFHSKLQQYIFLALALIAITLFVVVIKIFHMFRSVLFPIESLRSGVAKIASGNYATRCDISSANEIGELSANFNDMANFIEEDILMRNKAEDKLQRSENILSATLRSIGDGVITCDTEGNIINLNSVAENLTGWSTDEAKGRPIVEIFHTIHNETRQEAEDLVGRVLRENRVIDMAAHTALITRDGTEFQIADSCAPIHDEAGGIIGAVLVFRDISEEYHRHEQMECRHTLSYELLGILNSSLPLPDMLNAVISPIKRWTGFDAVGIRLQAGDDFPYFAQNGFPNDFLLTENTLVEHGKDGGLCRNIDGNVTLQCTCGLVISGKTDPANPLFTPGGSFWTNNSFSLLELPADQDPRLHPRNRCMHEGYGSLALIPIFENQKIVGLLQLNNRKADSLSLDTINFFELISANIGEALMRNKAEWALKERFKELNCLYGIAALIETPDISLDEILKKAVMLFPPAMQFPEITEARIVLEENIFQTAHFRETPWILAQKIIVNGKPAGQVEICYLEERPASDEGPFLIEERQLIGAVAERFGRLIERKRAESKLRESDERYKALFDHSLDLVYVYDFEGRFIDANAAALNRLGYMRDEIHSLNFASLLSEDQLPLAFKALYEIQETGIQKEPAEFRLRHKNGSDVCVETTGSIIMSNGTPIAIQAIARDITERKKQEDLILLLNEQQQIILDSSPTMIFYKDKDNRFIRVNEAFARANGMSKEEMEGKTMWEIYTKEAADTFWQDDKRVMTAGKPLLNIIEEMKTPKRIMWVQTDKIPYRNSKGEIIGIIGFTIDITERKYAEEKLAHLSIQNELVLNSAAEGILGLDLQGNHTFVNSAAARMLGYETEELIGRPGHSTWHHTKPDGSPYPKKECAILTAYLEGEVHRVSTEVFWRKDGTSFPVEYASTPIFEQGRTAGVVVTFADITERKKTEEQIQHLATHDLLTNLPSLGLARDRMSSAIHMARRYKKAVALMFVDLDGFKAVNDTLGHDAGDYVLKQVAQRLLSCVRETDTVARIGGDEFLIIATEINTPQNASQIAEKVIQLVSKQFFFKGHKAFVGASIGIALFPDHGKDMDQLIKQADEAMYRVKNAGKNGFRFVNNA